MLLPLSAHPLDLLLPVASGGQPLIHISWIIATQTPPAPSATSWDPTVIAATIGAAAAVIATLFATGVAIYQTRQSHRIERENRKIEREKDEMQRRHEQEMERFRRELDVQYREKEQEKQREEAARREMLTAQNNEARAIAYRKALHLDPSISRMQILDMQQPLEVANIYVCMRVHEDTVMRYAIDPALATAAERRDPDSFFQARHHYLEQRVGTAIDPNAVIRKYRRCVIIGDPGAGKTTLLKYLTLALADGKYPDLSDLPIHIALGAFVSSADQDILDYIARRGEECYAFPQTEARSYMDTMLRDGKAILLLDALDEAVVGEQPAQADASYQKAWNAIMHLATRYPEACIVVTARKAGYQQHRPLNGFTVVEVMDFRKEDISQFVENWFRCTQRATRTASADDLISRLDRNPRIQALAANPLLLSLIVLVYEAQLDLPDRRAELYRECVDVLLAKWDAKRNIRRRRIFKPDQKRQLLTEGAWHFHQQGRRYFPVQDLLREIAHFLPALGLSAEDNQQVLLEIANENGLLKEQARGWYGFLHLTLQEYFAATAVNDQSRFATLVSQCADPWWEEVLLLYAGQTPDASPLLLYLLGKDATNPRKDDLFHTNLLMAGRCLASFPTVRQKNLREEVIKRILALFLQTSYSRLREQARDVLIIVGGDVVIFRLVALIKDVRINHPVRNDIALALKQLGEQAVAQDLIGMLKDTKIADRVRGEIAWALMWLGEKSVARDMMEILKDRRIASGVHTWVALALGRLKEQSVAWDLIEMLKDHRIAAQMRGDIARGLGMLGERSVARDLVELLKDNQIDDEVRGNIAWALGMLREKSVAQELVEMLQDSRVDDEVRSKIAWALREIGERSVVPDLVEMLQDSRIAKGLHSNIAVEVGRFGERSVVPDLMEMLKDSQIPQDIRCDIAGTLVQLEGKSAVPDLMEILKDSQINIAVSSNNVAALVQLGDRSVVPELVEILKNSQVSNWVRSSIAEALGKLTEDEQTMETCVSLLSHTPAVVADAIYSALWDMSRRAEVTIVVQDEGGEVVVEFVPWQGEMRG